MINKIKINGEELGGIYVDSSLSFNKPAKNVQTFSIPGRSGSLIIDDGTWGNVMIEYPAYANEHQGVNFREIFDRIVRQLAPLSGYQRIETDYDPEHFRLGRVIVPEAPNPVRLNLDGFFTLSFDCKPQRYLTTGETAAEFTESSRIINPTAYPSKPLIRIYGTGTATVGNTEITLTDNTGNYTDIDCELMDSYRGAASRNQYVSFTGNDYPVLEPGDNQVLLGTGITKIEITPRWWEL